MIVSVFLVVTIVVAKGPDVHSVMIGAETVNMIEWSQSIPILTEQRKSMILVPEILGKL